MLLEGKTFVGNRTTRVVNVERNEPELTFSKQLENCLLDICRALDVSPPLWMDKNTKEFARFHKTVFTEDQFIEDVKFNRFQITWLDDGRNK